MMITKSHLKLAALFMLKLLGTGFFLWWAFSQVDDQQALLDNFKNAIKSPGWVTVGLAFGAVAILTGAMRWYVLLKAQSLDVNFPYIVRLTLIAALFNIVSVGGAGGNAARMISVMRRNPGKKLIVTLTVMMDHLIGFVSTGLIFLGFAWCTGVAQHTENAALKNMLVAATIFEVVGIFLVILLFVICSESFLGRFRKKHPWLARREHLTTYTRCLNLYRSYWKNTVASLLASIVLSASYFMAFYAALKTVQEHIEVATILTVMPIVDVASALPISISGLGVREKTFEYLICEMTSIGAEAAVSASLIGFMFHVFWGLVGGLVLIFKRSNFSAATPGSGH
ncbi:MAG: flippase-like domain-containing protein [Verrucomicrobiae bacterium]|nr:flippase-like domain-containing protein [Verrucomicrobiae bacterium]NNJ86856.1 flippase-like domain-containing protein [Akkermansiaceae bacterium]